MPVLKFEEISAVSLRVRKMLAASIYEFAMLTSMPVPKSPCMAATAAGGGGGAPGPPGTRRREYAARRRHRQPWRRWRRRRRLRCRLRRLQIVELFLKAADLRLVLLLNFSNLILQLFDLIVADCLRRGRDRQDGARQTGDQSANAPLSNDISLPRHHVPREINVVREMLITGHDIDVKPVNDPHRCGRIVPPHPSRRQLWRGGNPYRLSRKRFHDREHTNSGSDAR